MIFTRRVYSLVSKISRGKISTYGIIAKQLGRPKAARAVGRVLRKNLNHYLSNNKNKIPCHRVVRSDGRVGGYNQGISNKIKLLKKEGIKIIDNKVDNLPKYLHPFKNLKL